MTLKNIYNPAEIENFAISFWNKHDIFKKVREKVRSGPKFYFLDGPPFPSGETHPGTAANKVAKDFLIRYKRMKGFNVRDQPGWDMHGLPIEQKTEIELGLKDKRDILNVVGIEKFIAECKKFALRHMGIMERDFTRLGVWMDWEQAYKTITPEYMESVWFALKKVHERGLLYRGKKALSWCPRCATILAKNELDYKTIEDNSIYVKIPVLGKENEYLVIWTTTPWTIPFNMAIMVNPEFDYAKIRVDDEYWILAKDLANTFMAAVVGKPYEIVGIIPGEKLIGLRYRHPFYEEMPYHQKDKNAYFVVGSTQFVSLSAGSGLVHCAPGCGPEDFQIGLEYKIPIFNEVDEHGYLAGESGEFVGYKAREDDHLFVEKLREKGLLIAETPVEHEYAHCWRCESPIIYRATEQWFIAVSKIRNDILREIQQLYTVPDNAKKIFIDWISGFSDWCITLQRFWNIPAPIWVCDSCDRYEVIGRISELETKTKQRINDLHRPTVDKLTWKCEKCGGNMKRISDVLTGWLDSGAAPWASLEYPAKSDLYELFYPADFVMEGRDQIRAWFSAMMNFSMAAFGKRPYNAIYWHGFFNDENGRKMSKSRGNFIAVQQIINEAGGEPTRMQFIEWIAPGTDIKFNMKEIKENIKSLNVLWNIHNLILRYASYMDINPEKASFEDSQLDIMDRWLLSRLNTINKQISELFEAYRLSDIPPIMKYFWLEDISRWYIQNKRNKLSKNDETTLVVLYKVYMDLLRIISPLVPMTVETIYQDLKKSFDIREESIHLYSWPEIDEKYIDTKLEEGMEVVKNITTSILAAREKINRGVRWPIKAVEVITAQDHIKETVIKYPEIIKSITNTLEVSVKEYADKVAYKVKPNLKMIGPKFRQEADSIIKSIEGIDPNLIITDIEKQGYTEIQGIKFTKEYFIIDKTVPEDIYTVSGNGFSIYIDLQETEDMIKSGMIRELIRQIQELRKKAGLIKTDKIELTINAEKELVHIFTENREDILRITGAVKMSTDTLEGYKWCSSFRIRGKSVSIGLNKI